MDEVPDRSIINLKVALGQFRLPPTQRERSFPDAPRQKEVIVARVTVSPAATSSRKYLAQSFHDQKTCLVETGSGKQDFIFRVAQPVGE